MAQSIPSLTKDEILQLRRLYDEEVKKSAIRAQQTGVLFILKVELRFRRLLEHMWNLTDNPAVTLLDPYDLIDWMGYKKLYDLAIKAPLDKQTLRKLRILSNGTQGQYR